MPLKPIRRVVTGNDGNGKSKVVWDSPAPASHEASMGANRGHIDFWVWNDPIPALNGTTDDGNLPYDFPGPQMGGHWRVVQSPGKQPGYDAAKDTMIIKPHPPKETPEGRRWDRGGMTEYQGNMHKTETVDYAILVDGSRTLVLDDCSVEWNPGDIVIDIGAWHQWSSRTPEGGSVAFDMISAKFGDGPVGLAQGNDKVLTGPSATPLPPGVKPARRIVVTDREPYKSSLVSDSPTPDVRIDPARPGYCSQRMWVTDGTPCKIVLETLHLPHAMEPPPAGSVLNVVNIPPDANWKGKVGAKEVRAFFAGMGSPNACAWSADAPHPYMQKTRTLDFIIVQEGEVVLVLDTQEVTLRKGDFIVQRGTRHAWSNRTDKPAVLAIASHDGRM